MLKAYDRRKALVLECWKRIIGGNPTRWARARANRRQNKTRLSDVRNSASLDTDRHRRKEKQRELTHEDEPRRYPKNYPLRRRKQTPQEASSERRRRLLELRSGEREKKRIQDLKSSLLPRAAPQAEALRPRGKKK